MGDQYDVVSSTNGSMKRGGKDNLGYCIYFKNGNGQCRFDNDGHLIVGHDLHNHDEIFKNGITAAFIWWAKAENFSFFVSAVSTPNIFCPDMIRSSRLSNPIRAAIISLKV